MGARGKPRTRRGRKATVSNEGNETNNATTQQQQPPQAEENAAVPDCVRILRESTTYRELEEACADVGLFAAESTQHARLVALGVPQRLMQLLLLQLPHTPQPPNNAQVTDPVQEEEEQTEAQDLHKGWLYVRIAAADALHSMITHSSDDEVIDMLVAEAKNTVNSNGLGEMLLSCLQTCWQHCSAQETTWITSTNMNKGEGEGQQNEEHVTSRQTYFVLLRLMTELLRLVTAAVEGSEAVAETMSATSAVQLVGCVLRHGAQAMTTSLTDPALYNEATIITHVTAQPANEDGTVCETEGEMDDPRHTVVELRAGLALATGELLNILSVDNATLARLLTSDESCAQVHATLNELLGATTITTWLQARDANESSSYAPSSYLAMLSTRSQPALRQDYIGYTLLHLTLLLQATLMHVTSTSSAPSAEQIQRVLPLLTATLRHGLPMALWCNVAWPLLLDQCPLPEQARRLAVKVTTEKLRCTHVAVKVLHGVVNAICEQNARGEEDEVAFRANPLSALLYTNHTLPVFALLLRDVLWLENGETTQESVDVMRSTRRAAQQALHTLTEHNPEARTLQNLLLTTEVVVWEVANTLLLMVPVAQLGEASGIWRAMVQTLAERYTLLQAAIAAAQGVGLDANTNNNNGGGSLVAEAARALYALTRQTSSAQRLLWLQAEALTQMLWTLQRKQSHWLRSTNSNTSSESVNCNVLAATAADVDLLTRLSWEPEAGLTLRQACVGAVGLLCGSLGSAEAITVAARYALAVLQCSPAMDNTQRSSPSSSYLTLLQLEDGLVQNSTTAPTEMHARRAWLARLGFVDHVVSLRCEAANTLIDLFLDERYDETVYVPLKVHTALRGFLPQLRTFVKRREQLVRDCRRHHRLELECEAAENWAELEENLAGFLDYKAQTCKLS